MVHCPANLNYGHGVEYIDEANKDEHSSFLAKEESSEYAPP